MRKNCIDWLNDNTPPQISFYLVEIKACRIADSPVAPELDVVSKPNLETKVRAEPDDLKERHIWRKQMWDDVLAYIRDQKPPFRVQSPGTDTWSNIANW